MHSSRMRTVRSSSRLPKGVSAFGPGGICFWSQGGLLLVMGVSAFGPGGIPACNGADPPCEQND